MWNGYQAWATRRTSGATKKYTAREHVQYGILSCVALGLCVTALCWAVATLIELLAPLLH